MQLRLGLDISNTASVSSSKPELGSFKTAQRYCRGFILFSCHLFYFYYHLHWYLAYMYVGMKAANNCLCPQDLTPSHWGFILISCPNPLSLVRTAAGTAPPGFSSPAPLLPCLCLQRWPPQVSLFDGSKMAHTTQVCNQSLGSWRDQRSCFRLSSPSRLPECNSRAGLEWPP